MPSVSDFISYLESFAPLSLAEDWDNVGLLVGRRDAAVGRAMTCLTLTPDVAAEAIAKDVQLIVTHHPVLFRGAKTITDGNAEGRMLLDLVEAGVAVYSPHTAFDSANHGINQSLADSFGLSQIHPIRAQDETSELGSGRYGDLKMSLPLSDFLVVVRNAVSAEYVEFSGADDVSRVGIACGAAGEFLSDAITLGCDTFITGETRFHTVLEARTKGVNLILLGHYSSERPAVESLAEILDAEFDVDVFASQVESDPLRISHEPDTT